VIYERICGANISESVPKLFCALRRPTKKEDASTFCTFSFSSKLFKTFKKAFLQKPYKTFKMPPKTPRKKTVKRKPQTTDENPKASKRGRDHAEAEQVSLIEDDVEDFGDDVEDFEEPKFEEDKKGAEEPNFEAAEGTPAASPIEDEDTIDAGDLSRTTSDAIEVPRTNYDELLAPEVIEQLKFGPMMGARMEALCKLVGPDGKPFVVPHPPAICLRANLHGCGNPDYKTKQYTKDSSYAYKFIVGHLPPAFAKKHPGLVSEHHAYMQGIQRLIEHVQRLSFENDFIRPGQRQDLLKKAKRKNARFAGTGYDDKKLNDLAFDDAFEDWCSMVEGCPEAKPLDPDNPESDFYMIVHTKAKSLFAYAEDEERPVFEPLNSGSAKLDGFHALCGPGGEFKHNRVVVSGPDNSLLFLAELAEDPTRQVIYEGDLTSCKTNFMFWSQKPKDGKPQSMGLKISFLTKAVKLHEQFPEQEVRPILDRHSGDTAGGSDHRFSDPRTFKLR